MAFPGHKVFPLAIFWCSHLRGGSRPLLGDALVIASTFFFAVSNVGQEFCVTKKDQVEVVAMIGLFGMLVSVCEVAVLELDDLKPVKWSAEIILVFVGHAVAFFLFYTFVPIVLKIGGSTLLSLSLLTTNMWAVVFRIFFYKEKVNWLYYLSFGIVVVGIVIYCRSEKETTCVNVDEDPNQQSRLLDEETTVFLE